MKKNKILILMLALITQASFAQTFYKGKDANGNTIYSDKPLENGQPVEIKDSPTYSAPSLPASSSTSKSIADDAQKQVKEYQISILQPENEQTFTTDIETIAVKLNITPALQQGDKIRLFLNGQPSTELYESPTITLARLPRGSYQLHAEIIPQDNQAIAKGKSNSITFFQKRTTINKP